MSLYFTATSILNNLVGVDYQIIVLVYIAMVKATQPEGHIQTEQSLGRVSLSS